MRTEPARGVTKLRRQDGFTIFEVLIAVLVLTVGVLSMFTAFVSSQKLTLVSDKHESMVNIGQREIERVEGIAYSQIGLSGSPAPSSNPSNPDYYVTAGTPPSFEWDRTAGSTEQLDVDTANGTVPLTTSWSEGQFTGQMYDFITWSTDPKCGPGCPSSQDYKRITVAVTVNGTAAPAPVFVSSVISDPSSTPSGGVVNGSSGNPLVNPATHCQNAGQPVLCTSPIDSGNPNTYYLHDWPATGGAPQVPSANNTTHATVGTLGGLLCTTLPALATILSNITGCPVPDVMDGNAPPAGSGGTPPPLYNYSSDLGSTGFPGGRLLQPTCSNGTGCGTGSTSDCSAGGTFTSSLFNAQSEFWVSSPVTATTTLTGDGGLSVFTQTLNSIQAVVSFCIEIYDVPPSGSSGSLADILAWPPVALGGAAYVPPSDPSTGGNWPTSASQASFIFNFRGSAGSVSIAAGHRLGVRIWAKVNANLPIDVIYDNPLYPAQVQLNTQ